MPDDEDYQRPSDLDLDGSFSQGEDPTLSELAVIYGWEDWRDIIAPNGGYDETDMRPGIYFSPEDAMQEAHEVGIAEYATLWYDPIDEVWHLIVDHASDD